ncbi:MAG: HEAT repeat domain-containing protein [Nitrospirae bacterium]|nr:MAG: HEAT repeat domain-containing protein [Nitrospirota bacterium]
MSDSVAEHIAALHDADWGIREDAALALGTLGDPRGISPLIQALNDSDRAVRQAAISSLTKLGQAAVEPLGMALEDPNLIVQESAASILVHIADHRVVDPLMTALLSPNWIVRMYAAQALGRLTVPQAIDTLILLLQDKVKAVRDAAITALQAMREQAVPRLLDTLAHQDWSVRLRTVEALAILKPRTAVPALLDRLHQEPDTAVRQDIIRALGEIGDASAVRPLLALLHDPRVKTQVIDALGKLGDPAPIPALIDIVQDLTPQDYEDRVSACTDRRYQEELPVAIAAVHALARLGVPDTLPVLIQALRLTPIRSEAAKALILFGKAAVPSLIQMLKTEQDENIRYHVKETLAQLGWRPGQIRLA